MPSVRPAKAIFEQTLAPEATGAVGTGVSASPGLMRRLASMAYDALLLSVVWFITTFAFTVLTGYSRQPELRPLLQLLLLAVAAGYFVGFWRKGGQTPAMKTWRLRLVQHDYARVSTAKALLRFVLAGAGIAAFGASLLWALFDTEKQFLHDRLAGTRITRA